MNDLDQYELTMLRDLRFRIRRGDFALDRMPDAWYYRAGDWTVRRAGAILTTASFVGAAILYCGLIWLLARPW